MRIKTRLSLISGLSLGMVVFIGLAFGWTSRQESRANRTADLAAEMRKVVFDRALLRDEYLFYHVERARVQWTAKTTRLRELTGLAMESAATPGDRNLLKSVQEGIDRTTGLFIAVIQLHEGDGDRSPEWGRRLTGQLFLQAHDLNESVAAFHDTSLAAAMQAHRRASVTLMLFVSVVGLVLIAVATSTGRAIAQRIVRLAEAVGAIGAGNLDYRVDLAGNDELADLARATNEMAAQLKASYASRDELRKEVEERTRAEDALHRSNENLEHSNKELEQFAYVASHDLQEPLRMVASYTQLLAQRYEGQLDDKAKKYINYAVDGVMRMQRLINDLLAFSRIGTRGKPLEPTDTHAVLGEALRNLTVAIEESRVLVTTDDLPNVRADASQLALVFQNLIGNAIKFRKREDSRVHVAVADLAGEWVFSVRDNGIGIDPKFADRIFVIFQRLHTREEYPGTGIGLAVCKRIVERHGGRIWFESVPGKGSTFFFSIPK